MGAVHPLDRLAFIATKAVPADEGPAWSRWLRSHAAAHDGRVWRLLDPAPAGRPGAGHSHVIHLPADRLTGFDRETAVARADGRAQAHAEIRRDEWRQAGQPIVVRPEAEITGMIVAEVLCTDPDRVEEWDHWYDDQHLPDMMASGAFVAGSRWRRRPSRAGTADHLTIYEISGCTVEEAIEQSAAVMPGLIAQGRKHDRHTGGLTWALDATT